MAKKSKTPIPVRGSLAYRLDERLGPGLHRRGRGGLLRVRRAREAANSTSATSTGSMDCKPTTRDGEPAVEWTWDGNDEMDPAQGRGWAVVKGEELHGMIFFHGGDDSEFVAKKKGPIPKKPKR